MKLANTVCGPELFDDFLAWEHSMLNKVQHDNNFYLTLNGCVVFSPSIGLEAKACAALVNTIATEMKSPNFRWQDYASQDTKLASTPSD